MFLSEYRIDLAAEMSSRSLLAQLEASILQQLPEGVTPLRCVVTESTSSKLVAEVSVMSELTDEAIPRPDSIFRFVQRAPAGRSGGFNTVLIVPTGIGAEIGGHAGDAGPVVRLLGALSDLVITHPNVVNASDVNELPENGLYVEGSVLSRLLMGTVGLLPGRANQVLVVIDRHSDPLFVNAAVNTVNAARTTYGLACPEIVQLDPPIKMRARYADSGRAGGRVEGLERLCRLLAETRGSYDAVAISSVIDVPAKYHMEYFERGGEMVNPWGGVEAMLTHAVSCLFDVASAHSPMFESQAVANMDPGIVDPRMAAEAVSLSFFQCVLKGLHQAPRVVTRSEDLLGPGVLTASDVSALVIPDGCIGLPTLAALEQGIAVIAVKENTNVMRNDLKMLNWKPGQFWLVENYWEAAGVLAALKARVAADSVRRPMTQVELSVSARREQAEEASQALELVEHSRKEARGH